MPVFFQRGTSMMDIVWKPLHAKNCARNLRLRREESSRLPLQCLEWRGLVACGIIRTGHEQISHRVFSVFSGVYRLTVSSERPIGSTQSCEACIVKMVRGPQPLLENVAAFENRKVSFTMINSSSVYAKLTIYCVLLPLTLVSDAKLYPLRLAS